MCHVGSLLLTHPAISHVTFMSRSIVGKYVPLSIFFRLSIWVESKRRMNFPSKKRNSYVNKPLVDYTQRVMLDIIIYF